ncbi:HD domain-containing protein [Halobacterium bonnevillei]|uniref:HD domain-containing protein n=1 Tax=Halobacterium bonnevillei TaxID=2692200 RepID=A0A6B0SNU0_9EURY|nr:HD domain-containing protein [Halobacterium bonnevillei]MXR20652.1 HD domain-containing protein [Halobacterium bonnevillei]
MTTIKDSVHDHIEVAGVAADLVDTPPVQRLRRIKQLGTVALVYPSANHTRFEHSLGVFHLADRALGHLDIAGKRAERVRAAAILHDVGHSPFSHNVEDLLTRRTGKAHDDVDELVADGAVAGVLDDHGIAPSNVARLVRGDGELAQLIAGELDVDRMDYLVRDAHHTGVPYGTIDHGRLVRELTFIDGELVLDEGNVQTAESLLLARALMNPTVYSHHVARISKSMLRRGTERLLESSEIDARRLRRMDDHELSVALRTHDQSSEFGRRLAERSLYKRAVWAEMGDVDDDLIDADHDTVRDFEGEIAADAGVAEDGVILDVPGKPSMRESTTGVVVNGEVRRLDEQSTLVNALQVAQREQWRFGVYAPAGHVEAVGKAAERVLGLETEGALISEVNSPGRYASLADFE